MQPAVKIENPKQISQEYAELTGYQKPSLDIREVV